MPDVTAKIRAKGLDGTGFTENHARQAAYGLGGYTMAVVELRHEAVTNDSDGQTQVQLTISQVHPVPVEKGQALDEHLRRITQTLDYNRRVADPDQPQLEGMDEPQPIGEVIAQGVTFVAAEDQETTGDDE